MIQIRPELAHSWNVTPKEGIELQKKMAQYVITNDQFGDLQTVAGVDVGFEANGTITRAAVAVLRYPTLERIDSKMVRQPTKMPYIPGLLSFREIPAILEALDNLSIKPDMLLCDGAGYAHPRRFGLASHLGVLTDIPSIGVAKTRFIGTHADVGETRGEYALLHHKGEVIGAVLRTRKRVKPLYISIGHRVSLPSAIRLVMACAPKFRLPETTRQAHKLASVEPFQP